MSSALDATQFKFDSPTVPKVYDELLVPRLFLPWARMLLDRLKLRPGRTLVDVATGPGTVARLAAERLGPQGRVIATDISATMLAVAQGKAPSPGSAPIEYKECGAAPLLVPDAVADVVLCQQGLQFFPDRSAALLEMRRVLKPKGRVCIAVWAPVESCTVWSAYHRALAEAGLTAPAQLILAPFAWGSLDSLRTVVEAAGFRRVSAETRSLPIVFDGGVAQAYDALFGQPVGPAIAAAPEAVRKEVRAALAQHMAALIRNGQVHGQMSAHVAVAEA